MMLGKSTERRLKRESGLEVWWAETLDDDRRHVMLRARIARNFYWVKWDLETRTGQVVEWGG